MTNKRPNASRSPGQVDWMPGQVAREACRAELRAWCRAARRPSLLATATIAAVAVGGIAAIGATAPGTAAATTPVAFARAATGGGDTQTIDVPPWVKQPPSQAVSAATVPARPGSAAFWANPGVRNPYSRLAAAKPGRPSVSGSQPRHTSPASAPASHDSTSAPHRSAAQRHARKATTPPVKQPGKHAPVRKAAPPAKPYLIYDSVIPAAIPAGQIVATYVDGPYAASPAALSGHGQVLWIDVNGTDPSADALDVEPGDATPAGAATWTAAKLTQYPHSIAIIYTDLAWWPAVKAGIAALPQWMCSRVRYWIADPTGSPHVVPGASATQWYWGTGYDISTAEPGF